MAVFNGRDVKLPILTQIYQLDEKNPKELDLLAARVGGATEIPAYSDQVAPNKVIIPGVRDFDDTEVGEALAIIRPIMDALADDGQVSDISLNVLCQSILLTSAIAPYIIKERSGPALVLAPVSNTGEMIPIRSILFTAADMNPLTSAALNAMSAALLQRSEFLRCEECRNPFQVSLPGRNDGRQTYCSRRCSARAGTRRRRAQAGKPQEENSHVALS